jgi:hypothetical protein
MAARPIRAAQKKRLAAGKVLAFAPRAGLVTLRQKFVRRRPRDAISTGLRLRRSVEESKKECESDVL